MRTEFHTRQKYARLVREIAELAARLQVRPFPQSPQEKRSVALTVKGMRQRTADLQRLLHPEASALRPSKYGPIASA